jgi:hypothetical protein
VFVEQCRVGIRDAPRRPLGRERLARGEGALDLAAALVDLDLLDVAGDDELSELGVVDLALVVRRRLEEEPPGRKRRRSPDAPGVFLPWRATRTRRTVTM